jgi:hypothetical protein
VYEPRPLTTAIKCFEAALRVAYLPSALRPQPSTLFYYGVLSATTLPIPGS